jgi:type VI protein secretion system component VasF
MLMVRWMCILAPSRRRARKSKKILGQLAEMLGIIRNFELLFDLRESHSDMQQAELEELVRELVRHRDAFRNKIAVLTRDDEQFNKAVFVEMCANLDGLMICTFTDYEQAMSWIQSEGGLEDLWLES